MAPFCIIPRFNNLTFETRSVFENFALRPIRFSFIRIIFLFPEFISGILNAPDVLYSSKVKTMRFCKIDDRRRIRRHPRPWTYNHSKAIFDCKKLYESIERFSGAFPALSTFMTSVCVQNMFRESRESS